MNGAPHPDPSPTALKQIRGRGKQACVSRRRRTPLAGDTIWKEAPSVFTGDKPVVDGSLSPELFTPFMGTR